MRILASYPEYIAIKLDFLLVWCQDLKVSMFLHQLKLQRAIINSFHSMSHTIRVQSPTIKILIFYAKGQFIMHSQL